MLYDQDDDTRRMHQSVPARWTIKSVSVHLEFRSYSYRNENELHTNVQWGYIIYSARGTATVARQGDVIAQRV